MSPVEAVEGFEGVGTGAEAVEGGSPQTTGTPFLRLSSPCMLVLMLDMKEGVVLKDGEREYDRVDWSCIMS